MRKIILVFLLLFIDSHDLFSQNCFDSCFDFYAKLEEANIPFPERNKLAIQQLVGCKIPVFKARTMEGDSLNSIKLRGKVLVINFWFTSCAPCIAEMPALNRLVEEFKGRKDIIFIGFSTDNVDVLNQFFKEKVFKYEIVPNAKYLNEKFCLDINGWPTNLVVDKNGKLKKIVGGGFIDERAQTHIYNELKPVIKECLGYN